ncbi:MAG: phosphohydrolase, partial [Epsilonproteobacteria bacterium]
MKTDILIIDDNPKNIQLAANVLKSTNLYNIFFATSAQKGIDQLKKREFSLILLDINMPIMNGYEAAKIIKNDPNTSKIPILFLSANADQESINKGFEYGGADYITKPFQEVELTHRVKTHVELYISHKKLQGEVDESRILLEQYKQAMDAGLIVSKTDTKGIITYANDKFCDISQYSRQELIGHSHSIIRHPNTPSHLFKELWETVKQKQTWHGSLENRAKDGSSY